MRYIGGKFRQGKEIAKVIFPYLKNERTYIEPFCGAMGSVFAVAQIHMEGKIVLSDNHPALIRMWQAALFEGWIPPNKVTEVLYEKHKKLQDPKNPLVAFLGFGCAFAGKYFGTYARHSKDQARDKVTIKSNKNTLDRIRLLQQRSVTLKCCDYKEYANTKGAVFYLDPPYAGRTKQSKFTFNHAEFWEFARKLSKNNWVFITEFTFPDDFVSIHNFGDTVVRHHSGRGSDGTNEHIVIYRKGKVKIS